MNLTVIGLGLIGGSLSLDLRSHGFVSSVIGVDRNEEHCRLARNRGLVDEILPLESALKKADLVVLAVPVDTIVQMLPHILDQVGPETTVTDMGSTKFAVCESVASHPRRAQFVATHPMAGTEHSGPTAALRGLFSGRTGVVCDAEDSAAPHLRRIDEMYSVLKMRMVYMSSSEHDLHTAYISHLSHISSFVLAKTVLDKEKNVSAIFDLAGGGFESTVRLAKSSPEMWAPIFEQNREHLIDALGSYIDQLRYFQTALTNNDFDQIQSTMADANQIRRVLQTLGSKSAVNTEKTLKKGRG